MEFPETLPTQSDVLSQAEVERLLAQVAEEESTTVVHKPTGEADKKNHDTIQPYDFRQPAFLSASELRKLRLRHEGFIQSLAARLSIYLRLEFGLQMSKLQTVTYQKFVETLPNPTHLTLFKVEPLRGICLLDIPPRLGLTIVDRLLGGQAHSVNSERDLSEIEAALLDQAIQVIVGEWSNHWSSVQELRPVLLGHENNGRFLETAAHDTVMLALSMEARLGDCLEQMQIGIPYYTLEPLVTKLNASLDTSDREALPQVKTPVKWNKQMDDVQVPVVAEWRGLEVPARQIASLQVGDVLPLSAQFPTEISIRLAQLQKFKGRLGTRGKTWAVELTQVVKV